MFNRSWRGGRSGGRRYGFRGFSALSEAYSGILKDASGLEEFIKYLTGANSPEIEGYIAEITSNRKFHEYLEGNRGIFRRRSYGMGIGAMLGTMVYVLCRVVKPAIFVETGVSSGVSSSFILCALEENKHGKLYSIDLPWGEESGWLIPDYLRHRWHLETGSSSEKLPPLLEKLEIIDIFLHDSEHSYENMLWEYESAWRCLKSGGIILSHNIEQNYAFADFCKSAGVKGLLLSNMGGTTK